MAGLIAMRILADQAGDVRLITATGAVVRSEERVQPAIESFRAAHQFDVPVHIVRHEQAVLPRIGFREVEVHFVRIERLDEAAVAPCAEEAGVRVEEVLPIAAACVETIGDLLMADGFGEARYAPIIVGVLQGAAHTFRLVLAADVTTFAVCLQTKMIGFSAGHHRLQGQFRIEVADAFEVRISDHAHAVVADHAIGLVAPEFPHW